MKLPKHNMVQYSLWSNCCNNCDFCLKLEHEIYPVSRQKFSIQSVMTNLDYVDWDKFKYGVSLIGGELYYIKNEELQELFLKLIDKIIDIIKVRNDDSFLFSTVTNGMYDRTFLCKVIDKFVNSVGIHHLDLNFSYDLKYRYKSEATRLKVLENINYVANHYNYGIGVQMILTQHVINLWKEGKFDIGKFTKENFPKGILTFLYPHPVHTGKDLSDFQFKREDFLSFLTYMKSYYPKHYRNFINSTKHSGMFKHTGLWVDHNRKEMDVTQVPILSDGKEIIGPCGHSTLYRCYSDCDECMLCDISMVEGSF